MKDVRIVELRPAAAEEWDTAWEACDQATYFHSREWADLWQSWTNGKYRPQPQLARFEDGARAIIAASPRSERVMLVNVQLMSLSRDGLPQRGSPRARNREGAASPERQTPLRTEGLVTAKAVTSRHLRRSLDKERHDPRERFAAAERRSRRVLKQCVFAGK